MKQPTPQEYKQSIIDYVNSAEGKSERERYRIESIEGGRRTGQIMLQCSVISKIIKEDKSVFIAGDKYPADIEKWLNFIGIGVDIEESYTTPNLEPIYDNLFAIEPNVIGFTQKPKKLTGYIIKAKK